MAKVNIDIAVNQRRAQQKIDRLTRSTNKAKRGFNGLSLSIKNSSSAFGTFVGNVAAVGFNRLIGNLTSFGASSVKVTADIETLTTQFEVLTGSVGLANKAVEDLQQFAATTPFQFKDLAKSQQRLLSFGFTLEEVQDRMSDIGDVAAASGANIGELSLIFGQVRAAGKLTGERLLQLQERAIPIGPAIAKSLGVAESSVRDLVSKGKVDFKTFEDAFRSLNDTGEFAFEGMIKRSRTLNGRISTLKDNFELLQANVGSRLAPAFKAIVSSFTIFIQRIQNTAAFNSFLETLSNRIPGAIDFAINSFSFLINTVLNVTKVFNLFRSGATTVISTILKAFNALVGGLSDVVNAVGLSDTALGKGLASFKEFNDDVSSALDNTASEFAKSAAEISLAQETVNQAIDTGRKIITAAYNEELEVAKTQADGTIEAQTKKVETIKALTEAELAEIEKQRKARLKLINDIKIAEQELSISQEANRLFQSEQEVLFTDERLIRLEEYFNREQEATLQAQINSAQTEEEKQLLILQAQKKGQEARLKESQKLAESEVKVQRQKKQALLSGSAEIFGGLADVARLGGKKNFEIVKAASVAESVIRGILQVQQALSSPPGPPFTTPLAIGVGIKAAARTAQIASQSPGFEQGGIVPGQSFSGDRITARVNSGEMILNRQQQSQLFDIANGRGGSSGQEIVVQSTIMLNEEVVGEAVSRQVANGLVLGEVQ